MIVTAPPQAGQVPMSMPDTHSGTARVMSGATYTPEASVQQEKFI
jgi:hypothetical protein